MYDTFWERFLPRHFELLILLIKILSSFILVLQPYRMQKCCGNCACHKCLLSSSEIEHSELLPSFCQQRSRLWYSKTKYMSMQTKLILSSPNLQRQSASSSHVTIIRVEIRCTGSTCNFSKVLKYLSSRSAIALLVGSLQNPSPVGPWVLRSNIVFSSFIAAFTRMTNISKRKVSIHALL